MKRTTTLLITLMITFCASAQIVLPTTGQYKFDRKTSSGFAADTLTPTATRFLRWNGSGRITQGMPTISDITSLQATLDAKQALHANLTAISALTTTAYGLGLLELSNAAAARTYIGAGTGTVTSVGITGSNGIGVSGSPITSSGSITLSLGAITPTTVNGITLSGSSSPTLSVTGTTSVSGVNTGDQTSIVGITGTKAQFNTACTDGDFLFSGDVTSYTDEQAQDAVGGMVDATLVYVDGTPLLTRAALTGDVTAAQASNATTIANDAVSNAKAANMAQGTVKGRAAGGGTGDPQDLTPDQASTVLDAATDPFLRTSNFGTHTHAPADLTGFGADGGYLRSNGSAWVRVSGIGWADITGAPSFGDVVGPASSTDNNVPQWDGVTGKLLKDGLGISTGGNGVTDGLKLVQFNSNGGLQAAVTSGVGVLGVSSGGDGVQGTTSAGGSAALYGNTITAGCDALRLTNTGGTGKFLKAWAGGANNKLEIDLTGAISWPDGGTGPATTRTNLGLGTLATQNGTFSGTSSGTNTGDQTITLTGDVTGSGTGSFAATIANDAVTYAKIQDVTATDRLLGRSTAGAGIVEEITCTAAGRSLIDDASASAQRTTLGLGTAAVVNTGTGSGDVPTITNADARYIQQAIVDAKGDVLTATAADTPARLAVGTDGQVLTARSTESTGLVWATPVATVVSSHVNITWTNMPAAVDFIGGSNAFARVEKFDLTNATQFRVLANINVSGSASSKLIARYRTTYSTTASDYSVMGASSTEVSVPINGSAGTSADGGWVNITAAAKADVWIAFQGIDGNGTADPQFTVYFQTR